MAIALITWGMIKIRWRLFCVTGGPDQGSGSGKERLKWAVGFIILGIIIFSIERQN